MNLIEQLGGYEKLKLHFITTDSALGYTHVYLHGNNHYCFLDDSVDYIIPDRAILIKDVFRALLEYRRAHKIFEVGDKYLMLKINHKDLIIVGSDDLSEPWWNEKIIRHATDAEIAAGHRL